MNATKTNKMTHKQFYQSIMDKYPLTEEERTFIEGRIEQLEKKNSTVKKPTDKQVANDGIKASVLSFLSEHKDKKYTITQLTKEVPGLPAEISNQRMTSLVSAMVRAEEVDRVVEKRVSYFTAHTEEEGV